MNSREILEYRTFFQHIARTQSDDEFKAESVLSLIPILISWWCRMNVRLSEAGKGELMTKTDERKGGRDNDPSDEMERLGDEFENVIHSI